MSVSVSSALPIPPDQQHFAWPSIDSYRGLARAISLVENGHPGYNTWLASLSVTHPCPVIGITGPPGAGKSTLVDALAVHLSAKNCRIGIIAVDPSSPFHLGALLGDRIRMSKHYTNPNIFIRSLATRGSLGGLSARIIEVTDVMQAAGFDYIIIETVGVGQSEIEISGLADTTVVVLVPEGGDEIQGLKSGIMEIADIFVVNKSDRPGAADFLSGLKKILRGKAVEGWQIPVLPAVASSNEGIGELLAAIGRHCAHTSKNSRKSLLLAEKAYHLIQNARMKGVSKQDLAAEISDLSEKGGFNLYRFVSSHI
ncbi:MAG: methylmalonyl Co-A mutase-associated GTPase MeaB [Bacteroidota bacterium]|nr:methylmalonyl Co-A mutase-associated GTPase MeaB [Bacteroidota bacterium]